MNKKDRPADHVFIRLRELLELSKDIWHRDDEYEGRVIHTKAIFDMISGEPNEAVIHTGRCQDCEWYDKITSCQGECLLGCEHAKYSDSFCDEWTKKREIEEEDYDI